MFGRVALVSCLAAISTFAIACGGGGAEEAPAKESALTSPAPSTSAALPVAEPALPTETPAAPSLPPVQDYDGGGAPTPTPTPVTEAGAPSPTPTTPPGQAPVACPAGGEQEVEPNDQNTPNVLNGTRCGVVQPGEIDVLLVNKQQFGLKWSGFVNVQLEASANGYLVKITSQTPTVPTQWSLSYE